MTTRSQDPEFFKHVIETVIRCPMNGELVRALHHCGIYNHLDLLIMSEEEVKQLEYLNDSSNMTFLTIEEKQLVLIFQAYVAHNNIKPSDLIKITDVQFDEFSWKVYDPNAPIIPSTPVSTMYRSEDNERTVLGYILQEIYVDPIDGEISKALTQNGFFNHLDVLNMSSEDMESLTYINESNEEFNITSDQYKRIQDLQAYIAFLCWGELPKSHVTISSNLTPYSQPSNYK